DRVVQLNLVARNVEALGDQQVGDVAGRDRTVQLAGFTSRADDDEALAVEVLGNLGSLGLALLVAGFELGTLSLELLHVGFGRTERLALRQKVVACKTVLDADGVAHLTKACDTLEKNNLHCLAPSWPLAART